MDSLWPKFTYVEEKTNDSINIIRTQAKAIKKDTNGIVNATFSKISYKPGPIETVGNIMSIVAPTDIEEKLDDELINKKDINALYQGTEYKFEIYNTEYRFRLFVLKYRVDYPISLNIDAGIVKDIHYSNNEPISSNEELEKVLKEIFSSQKVYSVVSKMIQYEKKKTEQK